MMKKCKTVERKKLKPVLREVSHGGETYIKTATELLINSYTTILQNKVHLEAFFHMHYHNMLNTVKGCSFTFHSNHYGSQEGRFFNKMHFSAMSFVTITELHKYV